MQGDLLIISSKALANSTTKTSWSIKGSLNKAKDIIKEVVNCLPNILTKESLKMGNSMGKGS